MAKGIRRCDDHRGACKWSQKKDRPTFATREEVASQMNEWSEQWNIWLNEVLLAELNQAFDEFQDAGFEQAMKHINAAGTDMHKAGCRFFDLLNNTYPPSHPSPAIAPGGGPPIVTDSTKPPPPPFGGGK